MPGGLENVFAAGTKQQPETSGKDTDAAHITGHRVLGTGKAAFEVSALGFGVMGMTYNRSQHPDKKQCIRLLHEAVDRGVTLFDTAIIYGPLNNEELAGEALSEFKGKINVTTKFGHEVINGKGTGRQDSRPQTIRRYCEESLRRLRLDSLPMFYQHRADPNVSAEEVASTIADLMKEGKVQHWGMCEVSPETIRKAHAVCPLTAIQSGCTVLWRITECLIPVGNWALVLFHIVRLIAAFWAAALTSIRFLIRTTTTVRLCRLKSGKSWKRQLLPFRWWETVIMPNSNGR